VGRAGKTIHYRGITYTSIKQACNMLGINYNSFMAAKGKEESIESALDRKIASLQMGYIKEASKKSLKKYESSVWEKTDKKAHFRDITLDGKKLSTYTPPTSSKAVGIFKWADLLEKLWETSSVPYSKGLTPLELCRAKDTKVSYVRSIKGVKNIFHFASSHGVSANALLTYLSEGVELKEALLKLQQNSVTFNGVVFKSQMSMCEHYGKDMDIVSLSLANGLTLQRIFLEGKKAPTPREPIEYAGVVYTSLTDLLKVWGISLSLFNQTKKLLQINNDNLVFDTLVHFLTCAPFVKPIVLHRMPLLVYNILPYYTLDEFCDDKCIIKTDLLNYMEVNNFGSNYILAYKAMTGDKPKKFSANLGNEFIWYTHQRRDSYRHSGKVVYTYKVPELQK
jgi:hypothetical protein